MVVESHVYISGICLSLLCSLHYLEKYDQTLRTDKGKCTDRHLLLYSAVFWPWHFSCCKAVNDYDSNILNIVWNMFILVYNYLKWLLYYQSVIEWGYNGITGDLFWRKSHVFAEQKTDDLLCAACVFGLSRTLTILFESRFSIELEDSYLDQLLLYACEFGYLKLVQYLLEEGANAAPTSRTISGHRCIMLQHRTLGTNSAAPCPWRRLLGCQGRVDTTALCGTAKT
jgi:hypothetical protein